MATTVSEVMNSALELLGRMQDDGTFLTGSGQDDYKYAKATPRNVSRLQNELLKIVGKPPAAKISDSATLTSTYLEVSDDVANEVLVYGLARNFAIIKKDGEKYNMYAQMYENEKSKIKVLPTQPDMSWIMEGLE